MAFQLTIFDLIIALRSNMANEKDLKARLIKAIEKEALSHRAFIDLSVQFLGKGETNIPDVASRFLFEDIENIVDALKHCSTVTGLDLSGHNMGDEGVRRLLPLLEAKSRLRVLYLANNSISDKGVEIFLRALEKNSQLYALDPVQHQKITLRSTNYNYRYLHDKYKIKLIAEQIKHLTHINKNKDCVSPKLDFGLNHWCEGNSVTPNSSLAVNVHLLRNQLIQAAFMLQQTRVESEHFLQLKTSRALLHIQGEFSRWAVKGISFSGIFVASGALSWKKALPLVTFSGLVGALRAFLKVKILPPKSNPRIKYLDWSQVESPRALAATALCQSTPQRVALSPSLEPPVSAPNRIRVHKHT